MNISPHHLYKNKKKVRNKNVNKQLLSTNERLRKEYQETLENKIIDLKKNKENRLVWQDIV